MLPGEALVTLSEHSHRTGRHAYEQLTAPDYEYYKTPLRPTSGDAIESTVFVNEPTRTFTSTGRGDSSNNPVDPTVLTTSRRRIVCNTSSGQRMGH